MDISYNRVLNLKPYGPETRTLPPNPTFYFDITYTGCPETTSNDAHISEQRYRKIRQRSTVDARYNDPLRPTAKGLYNEWSL
ncbi:hypothetical protein AVEN_159163-1 [Araneus ventricosus]|uniref:Uncharacterized protein n=1 Tax=Araneus ventricosus TaxID=182803 RepID=A0A4Y2LF92_ARAVE|nr:hypothetical protein AVEN_159163-1 [Araneus ventricosus]